MARSGGSVPASLKLSNNTAEGTGFLSLGRQPFGGFKIAVASAGIKTLRLHIAAKGLAETAQLMESLGCVIAFNLDGGQTTQLYWNGAIANEPFRGGRSTSDIICIVEPHADSADPVE